MSAPTTAKVRAVMSSVYVTGAERETLQHYALPIAEHRDALAAEVARLRSVADGARQAWADMSTRADAAEAEVARLREALRETATTLSRISYLCGAPNDQEVSAYDVAPVASVVIAQVERLAAALSCSASPYGVHRCCRCDSEVTP